MKKAEEEAWGTLRDKILELEEGGSWRERRKEPSMLEISLRNPKELNQEEARMTVIGVRDDGVGGVRDEVKNGVGGVLEIKDVMEVKDDGVRDEVRSTMETRDSQEYGEDDGMKNEVSGARNVKDEVRKTVFGVRNVKKTTWANKAGDENMMVRGENADVKESQKSHGGWVGVRDDRDEVVEVVKMMSDGMKVMTDYNRWGAVQVGGG